MPGSSASLLMALPVRGKRLKVLSCESYRGAARRKQANLLTLIRTDKWAGVETDKACGHVGGK